MLINGSPLFSSSASFEVCVLRCSWNCIERVWLSAFKSQHYILGVSLADGWRWLDWSGGSKVCLGGAFVYSFLGRGL
jgi:hypothetical protein